MIKNNFLDNMNKKDLPLTPRQIQVLQLRANGFNRIEIAEELNISIGTVKNHINCAMDNLRLDYSRRHITFAVAVSYDLGLII